MAGAQQPEIAHVVPPHHALFILAGTIAACVALLLLTDLVGWAWYFRAIAGALVGSVLGGVALGVAAGVYARRQ